MSLVLFRLFSVHCYNNEGKIAGMFRFDFFMVLKSDFSWITDIKFYKTHASLLKEKKIGVFPRECHRLGLISNSDRRFCFPHR